MSATCSRSSPSSSTSSRPARGSPTISAEPSPPAAPELAAGAVEAALGDHPDLPWRRVAPCQWIAVLQGTIRHAVPVSIEVGTRICTLTSFLLRGPSGPGTADLHRVLLRKNRSLVRARICLDTDDDVVLVARLPLRGLTADDIDEALGEILTVSESSFEALVHVGYPGVFQPLRTSVP